MKITAPVKGFNESTEIGPVVLDFKDGVAEYDGTLPDGVRAYLKEQGYGLGNKEPVELDKRPEPLDPRSAAADEQVGTKTRDAAVTPLSSDFLAPTNAGEANPHGSTVVSPEIHASEGIRPVKAGDVHVDDSKEQDAAEKAHAAAATDGTPVTLTDAEKPTEPEVVDPGAEPVVIPDGDLDNLVDWVSAADDQDEAKRRADAVYAQAKDADDGTDLEALSGRLTTAVYGTQHGSEPTPAEVIAQLKGQALDEALDERGLPKTGSADEKRARVAEHDAKLAAQTEDSTEGQA